MTDAQVAKAAVQYLDGHSLPTLAEEFNIHARTLTREFHNAGIEIRPRRGWQY